MSPEELFEREETHLGTLVDLLRQEFDTLLQHPVDGAALEQLASAKQQQLGALEHLESLRRDSQASLGYPDTPAGAEQAARDQHCLAPWQRVLDGTRRAEHLNRLNGTLIQQRLDHNRRVLGALRELAGNPLYGIDGQSRRHGGSLSYKA